MKTLITVLALAALSALVALSSARPHRGHGGQGGKHPHQPCRIVFTNGTEVTNECPDFGGLIVCEKVNLTRFDDRPMRRRKLENVTELFVCIPKQCTQDTDCSSIDANSVCTDEPVRPDREVIEPLIEACFPDMPHRPQRPDGSERPGRPDLSDEDEDDARPLRCSLPPAMHIAKKACLVTYDGEDIGTPCRGRFGVEGTCNATVACTLSIAGQDAALHFCEHPPRPTGGFGAQFGNGGFAGGFRAQFGNGGAQFGNGGAQFGNGGAQFGNGGAQFGNGGAQFGNGGAAGGFRAHFGNGGSAGRNGRRGRN